MYKADFDHRKRNAAVETVKWLRGSYERKKQDYQLHRDDEQSYHTAPSESDESSINMTSSCRKYTVADNDDEVNKGAVQVDFNAERVTESFDIDFFEHVVNYIHALPHCAAMYIGFHQTKEPKHWCFCPCGRHMHIWRTKCNVYEIIDSDGCCRFNADKTKEKTMTPRGFLDHLRTCGGRNVGADAVVAQKYGPNLHQIVEYYLTKVYKNYWGPDLHHQAFHPLNSVKANMAEKKESEFFFKKNL